jgi:hypothetical protein
LIHKLQPQPSYFELIARLQNSATVPHPQLFVIANYGLKRKEERDMRQSGFSFEEEMNFEPKLRAVEVIANAAVSAAGLRI